MSKPWHPSIISRHLYDLVESHVRSLKSLGVTLISFAKQTPLRDTAYRQQKSWWRLLESRCLNKGGRGRIVARERTMLNPPPHVKRPPNREQATAAALLSGSSTSGPTCCYCGQPHTSSSCETVKSMEERRRILRRCCVCMRKGHISRNCRSNARYANCRGCHHVSMSETPIARNNPTTSHTRTEPSASSTSVPGPCVCSHYLHFLLQWSRYGRGWLGWRAIRKIDGEDNSKQLCDPNVKLWLTAITIQVLPYGCWEYCNISSIVYMEYITISVWPLIWLDRQLCTHDPQYY